MRGPMTKTDVFYSTVIEGLTFEVARKPQYVVIECGSGWVQPSDAEIRYREEHAGVRPGWWIVKYDIYQPRIFINSLTENGRMQLAQQLGLTYIDQDGTTLWQGCFPESVAGKALVGLNAPLKSKGQLDELKQQWAADPCWDIEYTEGFEAYRDQLYVWRLEHELKYEQDNHRRLKQALDVLKSVTIP